MNNAYFNDEDAIEAIVKSRLTVVQTRWMSIRFGVTGHGVVGDVTPRYTAAQTMGITYEQAGKLDAETISSIAASAAKTVSAQLWLAVFCLLLGAVTAVLAILFGGS